MRAVIVLEGPDRAGKNTQCNMLADRFRKKGKRVAVVEVPYSDPLTHGLIYRMLEDGTALKHPNLFQLLQFGNKLLFQLYVLPLLWLKNDYIILDRWSLSCTVYGAASGAKPWLLRMMAKLLMKPDMTFVLDAPNRVKEAEDTFEANEELQRTVAELYETHCDGDTVVKVDASGSKEDTHQSIWWTLAWLNVSSGRV